MGEERSVIRIVEPVEVLEGGGVPVKRVLPSDDLEYEETDPFLLLDVFDASKLKIEGKAFPAHPHRGFEIITYILKGRAGHSDDMGNKSIVRGGGLQKITAGKGMWHEEGPVPGEKEGTAGLQLWINLARRDKAMAPSYQALQPEEVPVVKSDGITIRKLVGSKSPVQLHTPAKYIDVQLGPGFEHREPVLEGHQGFVYLLEGQGEFGPDQSRGRAGQLLLLGEGSEVSAEAGPDGLRFVLAAGKPHREPIRWMGPFVD